MKRFLVIGMMFFISGLYSLSAGAPTFKRIDQWRKNEVVRFHLRSCIDKENQLIANFARVKHIFLMDKQKCIKWGLLGEGPDNVMSMYAIFPYKGDIAVVDMTQRMKVFTKKNGTYVWKETKWLARGKYLDTVFNGAYADNKIFLTGFEGLEYFPDRPIRNASFLKVLNDNGKFLKHLVKRSEDGIQKYIQMSTYVNSYKNDRVFHMFEDELKVTVISAKTLETVKEVKLETPPFYKKLPDDFYILKDTDNFSFAKLELAMENWTTGYSRINTCVVDGNYLILQVRTCSDKLKKFAILFYNAETFKLENTVFTNDFLLTAKDGKYYCYENGNPSVDENTDDMVINVYAFVNGK